MDYRSQELVPLREDHAYLRATPNSVYWSLAPHSIQQATECSCSLATAVVLLNAVRGCEGRLRIGESASEASLLNKLNDADWRAATAITGDGITLTEFAPAMRRSLGAYGCDGWDVEIHMARDPEATVNALRELLTTGEQAPLFVAANFLLDRFYGDGVDIGHFAPIGAYDAARDRVLMLDVYKKDYEPMWGPLPRLVQAMATVSRKTGEPRGFAVVKRRA